MAEEDEILRCAQDDMVGEDMVQGVEVGCAFWGEDEDAMMNIKQLIGVL